jgi:hypothetical protein
MSEFGLGEKAALLLAGAREAVGLPYDRLLEVARRADVLVNISGMLTDESLTGRIPVRVYLDLDPAFNQLWHTAQGIDMRFAGHSHFMTAPRSETGVPTGPSSTGALSTDRRPTPSARSSRCQR